MKTSKESLGIYKKINDLWLANDCMTATQVRQKVNWYYFTGRDNPFEKNKIDYKLAKSICRQIYKRTLQKKCPFVFENETGRRHNWRTWSKKNVYNINTDTGWSCLTHDFSHWMHHEKYNGNKRPHCAEHAALELRMTKLVLEKLNKVKQEDLEK